MKRLTPPQIACQAGDFPQFQWFGSRFAIDESGGIVGLLPVTRFLPTPIAFIAPFADGATSTLGLSQPNSRQISDKSILIAGKVALFCSVILMRSRYPLKREC